MDEGAADMTSTFYPLFSPAVTELGWAEPALRDTCHTTLSRIVAANQRHVCPLALGPCLLSDPIYQSHGGGLAWLDTGKEVIVPRVWEVADVMPDDAGRKGGR